MKKILAVLGLFVAFSIFGQGPVMELPYRNINLHTGTDKTIEGTPFIYPEYQRGSVSGFPESYKMRYNAYLDEVNFKKDDADLALLKEKVYGTIHFNETNEILKLEQYTYKKSAVQGYLFVVADKENVTIYKKLSMSYSPFKEAKNSYDTDSPAKYKKLADVYFIKRGNSEIVEMASNKNQLIEMFPEKKDAINQYFKANKVNLSDSKELKKLAEIL